MRGFSFRCSCPETRAALSPVLGTNPSQARLSDKVRCDVSPSTILSINFYLSPPPHLECKIYCLFHTAASKTGFKRAFLLRMSLSELKAWRGEQVNVISPSCPGISDWHRCSSCALTGKLFCLSSFESMGRLFFCQSDMRTFALRGSADEMLPLMNLVTTHQTLPRSFVFGKEIFPCKIRF